MSAGQTFLGQFADDILVRCPSCSGCGHLLRLPAPPRRVGGFRFVCPKCASCREWLLARDRVIASPGIGPQLTGFHLSLWLQVPCCGQVLWAYNARHVAFLERYVGARMRSQRSVPRAFLGNATLESRLPRWLLSAKNRQAVLRGLQSLREQLVAAKPLYAPGTGRSRSFLARTKNKPARRLGRTPAACSR